MAKAAHEIVPGDESEIHDEPHLAGRRITVLRLAALVEEAGRDPAEIAESFDLPVGDVYRALAYYHDHPDEMEEVRRQRAEAERRALERDDVKTLSEIIDESE